MGSLTLKLFLKLQKRIAMRLTDYAKLEDKKTRTFKVLKINDNTKMLSDKQKKSLKQFYLKHQLPLIKEIMFDLGSYDNNIIENRDFVARLFVFIKYAKRNELFRNLLGHYQVFLRTLIGGIHEIQDLTLNMIHVENASQMLDIIKEEKETTEKLLAESISFSAKLRFEMKRIKDIYKPEVRKTFDDMDHTSKKLSKAGFVKLSSLLSFNIATIGTLVAIFVIAGGCKTMPSGKQLASGALESIQYGYSKVVDINNEEVTQKKIQSHKEENTSIPVPKKKSFFSDDIVIVDQRIPSSPELIELEKQESIARGESVAPSPEVKNTPEINKDAKDIYHRITKEKHTKKWAKAYNLKFIEEAAGIPLKFLDDDYFNKNHNMLIVARAIFFEAGNQEFIGKIMVGSTIYNSAATEKGFSLGARNHEYYFAQEIFKDGRYESLPKIRSQDGSGNNWEDAKRVAYMMCKKSRNPDNSEYRYFLNKKIVQKDRGQSLPTFCYNRHKIQILEVAKDKYGKVIIENGRPKMIYKGKWEWKYPKLAKNAKNSVTIEDHTFYKDYEKDKSKPLTQEEYQKILKKLR